MTAFDAGEEAAFHALPARDAVYLLEEGGMGTLFGDHAGRLGLGGVAGRGLAFGGGDGGDDELGTESAGEPDEGAGAPVGPEGLDFAAGGGDAPRPFFGVPGFGGGEPPVYFGQPGIGLAVGEGGVEGGAVQFVFAVGVKTLYVVCGNGHNDSSGGGRPLMTAICGVVPAGAC